MATRGRPAPTPDSRLRTEAELAEEVRLLRNRLAQRDRDAREQADQAAAAREIAAQHAAILEDNVRLQAHVHELLQQRDRLTADRDAAAQQAQNATHAAEDASTQLAAARAAISRMQRAPSPTRHQPDRSPPPPPPQPQHPTPPGPPEIPEEKDADMSASDAPPQRQSNSSHVSVAPPPAPPSFVTPPLSPNRHASTVDPPPSTSIPTTVTSTSSAVPLPQTLRELPRLTLRQLTHAGITKFLQSSDHLRTTLRGRNSDVRFRELLDPPVVDAVLAFAATHDICFPDDSAVSIPPEVDKSGWEEPNQWDATMRRVLFQLLESAVPDSTTPVSEYDRAIVDNVRFLPNTGSWQLSVSGFRGQWLQFLKTFRLQSFYTPKDNAKHAMRLLARQLPTHTMRKSAAALISNRGLTSVTQWFDALETLEHKWKAIREYQANDGPARAAGYSSPSPHRARYDRSPSPFAPRDYPRYTSSHRERDDRHGTRYDDRRGDSRDSRPRRDDFRDRRDPPDRGRRYNDERSSSNATPRGGAANYRHVSFSDTNPSKSPPAVARRVQPTSSRPSAPRDGCAHCKGAHWVDDCPSATPAQRSAAKRAFASNSRHRGPKPSKPALKGTIRQLESVGANCIVDGTLSIAGLSMPFACDSGASHNFISKSRAQAAVNPRKGVTMYRLHQPFGLSTANAPSSAIPLLATHCLVGPATATRRGKSVSIPRLSIYVVDGLADDMILIGRRSIASVFNIVIHTLLDDLFECAPRPMSPAAAPTRSVSPAKSPTAPSSPWFDVSPATDATARAVTPASHTGDEQEQSQLNDAQPEVLPHNDPEAVRDVLEQRFTDATAAIPAADRPMMAALRDVVMSRFLDCFRLHLCIEPTTVVIPGMPDGLKVFVDDALFSKLRMSRRNYAKPLSDMLAEYMARLEAGGYIIRDPLVTYASPMHAVRKHDAPPGPPSIHNHRATVDMRQVNACMPKSVTPIPRLAELRSYLAGHRYFGKIDLNNGFWQLPLHPDSRRYFGLATDRGTWVSTRLIQGSRNAAGPFHQAVSAVLGDALYHRCLLYVDDILIMGRTADEFYDNWNVVLDALRSANFTISAKKTIFFASEVEYCGHIVCAEGVKPNPRHVAGILEIPTPTNAADLRQFIGSVLWLREAIPRHAELLAPLQQLLTASLRLVTGRSNQAAARRIDLRRVGWTTVHDAAFDNVKRAVADAVTLSHVEESDEWELCVFTDASDLHWSGIVTQRRVADGTLPIMNQRHQPLLFVSSSFKDAQTRWAIVDKEAYAIKETCCTARHILTAKTSFTIFTDHRNLAFIFAPASVSAAANRVAADRIQRWILIMSGFNYSINYIPGTANAAADMLSRWGNPAFIATEPRPTTPTTPATVPTVTPTVVASTPGSSPNSAFARMVTTRARSRRDTTITPPPATPSVDSPDTASDHEVWSPPIVPPVTTIEIAPDEVSTPADTDTDRADASAMSSPGFAPITANDVNCFSLEDAPSEDEIIAAQAHVTPDEISRLKLVRDDEGVLRSASGTMYIPNVDNLRLRLTVVAHQGIAAHRGSEETMHNLTTYCYWPRLAQETRQFCANCLSCLKVKGGRTIPRPNLATERASEPNEMIHFDFVHVRSGSDADSHDPTKYILVVMDNYSRYVHLYPSARADADTVVDALLDWFSRYGIAFAWTSDNGSHFFNEIIRSLASYYGVRHHFTAVYAPWSNGVVERVNREIRHILSSLMADRLARDDSWPWYLPIVTFALNNSHSSAIAGFTPFEAFLGRTMQSPLVTVFRSEFPRLRHLDADRIRVAVTNLRNTLDGVHDTIQAQPTRARNRGHVTPIDFGVGDYVLYARGVADKHREKDKTRPLWFGPAQVISQVNGRVFEIIDIANESRFVLHAQHLKRYADRTLNVTPRLRQAAAYGGRGFVAERVVNHRFEATGSTSLLVQWEEGDLTWEPSSRFKRDAPALYNAYKRTLDPTEAALL